MEAIMISIKPEAVKAIASGRKRAGLMKKRPQFLALPFKIYIYEMRGELKNAENIGYTEYRHDGRGKVVGECICNSFRTSDDPVVLDHMNVIGMTSREYSDYFGGKIGHVFYFSDVKMYEQPLPLESFGKTAPPQSWCHVKELKESEKEDRSMEAIKTSENMEFDVIYADGTRRHVSEGVLFEIKDDSLIFHNGTNRATALFSVAEAAAEVVGAMGLPESMRAQIMYKIHNRIFAHKDAAPDMKKNAGGQNNGI